MASGGGGSAPGSSQLGAGPSKSVGHGGMVPTRTTSYRVKLADTGTKKYSVMRFKHPHKCDPEKLVNPTLERQVAVVEELGKDNVPEEGEGSEYGRKWRQEARRKKRGYAMRKVDPDSQPWVLKEQRQGGKHFIGRKEGGVDSSSSYYILTTSPDESFAAYPVKTWYDFVPPVKYNYLTAEEAEEKFERRNKTLNYFTIMLSKKLKNQEGEDREGMMDGSLLGGEGGGGRGEEGGKGKKKKLDAADKNLLLTDSDSGEFTSESSDNDAEKKRGKPLKKKHVRNDSEVGEDTDEGEMESREVDYLSDASSEEEELKVKEILQDAPKDDEELERQEEGEIDKGFSDSESSDSDQEKLTKEGKEIQALMKKQMGGDAAEDDLGSEEEMEEEGEGEGEGGGEGGGEGKREKVEREETPGPSSSSSSTVKKQSPPNKDASPKKKAKSGKTKTKTSLKRGLQETSESSSPQAQAQATSKDGSSSPAAKKAKVESTSTITEEEVRRYLTRKPFTSKELVKKFTSKKTDLDKNKVVTILGNTLKKMGKEIFKEKIKDKLYLSIKS